MFETVNIEGEESGNKSSQSVSKSKIRKRRKQKKEEKPPTKEEIERRKIFGNIVHKKVTPSSNWKNFIEQKLHLDNEVVPNNVPKSKNYYDGQFRRNRKNLEQANKTGKIVTVDLVDKSEHSTPSPLSSPKSEDTKSSKHKPRSRPNPTVVDSTEPCLSGALEQKLTRFIGIDCEMVGVDDDEGRDNMLARVSLVNKFGECLYDKFVKPKEDVIDYRTHVSGVRPMDLKDAECFETVQKEVAGIIKGRILVGHGLSNDLKVLYLSHPRRCIRDTSKFEQFRLINKGRTPSLKKLAATILGVTIQEGEHNPVIDAKAAMQLYMMYKKEWEAGLRTGKGAWSKSRRKPRVQTAK